MKIRDQGFSRFFNQLIQEVPGRKIFSPLVIERRHQIKAFSVLAQRGPGASWSKIMLGQMAEACPMFYDKVWQLYILSIRRRLRRLEGKLILKAVDERRAYDFWWLLGVILLPVFYANHSQWPLIADAAVESCYQKVLKQYSIEFDPLYPELTEEDLLEEVEAFEGKDYRRIVEELILQSPLAPHQIVIIALLVITFFELVPCKLFSGEKEESPH